MKPFAISNILAPTDLSEVSVPALRYARLLADHFFAKLTVMYSDPIVYPSDFVGPVGAFYVNLGREHLERRRGEVERHAALAMEGKPYDIDVTVGNPIPSILGAAAERHADFIVVGTHLRHGWRRALVGSVSDGVIHGSGCPVLSVAADYGLAGPASFTIRNVVCPVNFTEVAAESLEVAAGMAAAFGARLTIVHVVERADPLTFAHDEARVRNWIDPELQTICAYRELAVRGDPAERVLDCADDLDADLLVVGAQHKLFRDATVIGTTTERLVRFAACPVLVVPREAVHPAAEVKEEELVLAER